MVQICQGVNQGLCSALAMRSGLQGDIELVGERQARKRQLHTSCFGEHDSEVFDNVIDEETGLEIPLQYSWAKIA